MQLDIMDVKRCNIRICRKQVFKLKKIIFQYGGVLYGRNGKQAWGMAQHRAYRGIKPSFGEKVFNNEVPVLGGVILREKTTDHESDFPELLPFMYKTFSLFIRFGPQQLCPGYFSCFRNCTIGPYFL